MSANVGFSLISAKPLQDVASLNPFLHANMGISPDEKPLAISGRNWGEAELEGTQVSTLCHSIVRDTILVICWITCFQSLESLFSGCNLLPHNEKLK